VKIVCLRQVEGQMGIAKVDHGECKCRETSDVPPGQTGGNPLPKQRNP
jgi:hypothetical protein